MQVVAVRVMEDCFAASSMVEVTLDEPVTAAHVRALAPLGRLEYHPEFPRPFFRLRRADGSSLKGVVGTDRMRVILAEPAQPEAITRALAPIRSALEVDAPAALESSRGVTTAPPEGRHRGS